MNNIKKIAATLAILGFLPFAALAHGNNVPGKGLIKAQIKTEAKADVKTQNDNDSDDSSFVGKITPILPMPVLPWRFHKSVNGSVTAVSSTGFSLTAKDGSSVAVNTAGAKIINAYGAAITLSDISVNENAMVQGSENGSQINATLVVVTPASTHPAKATGTVTAVNGSTITVQSSHDGVVYPVTINTNASTTVMSNGATTTLSAIQVGSKINVKGLWDEVLNVLNAIRIRIK